MSFPGQKTVRQGARWLRSRVERGGLVLGYHRVGEVAWDPYAMQVTPEHFEAHLQVLRELAQPVSVQTLLEQQRSRSFSRNAVALTFDDGYRDNLDTAAPLLESYEIPATIFVVTHAPETMFWWDELARLVGSPVQPVSEGPIWPNGLNPSAPPADAARATSELLRLYHQLLPLSEEDRQARLCSMRVSVGADSTPPTLRLTPEQVRALHASRWIEIGSHTATHPMLPRLSAGQQEAEVVGSKVQLEAILGEPVGGLSYPNGAYSAATRDLVARAGYRYACTSKPDVMRARTNPYEIPRFWVGDWDKPTFTRWLKRWLCS